MILEEKLKAEIEQKKVLEETQGGFRSGRSTIDNILILNYIVKRVTDKRREAICLFCEPDGSLR